MPPLPHAPYEPDKLKQFITGDELEAALVYIVASHAQERFSTAEVSAASPTGADGIRLSAEVVAASLIRSRTVNETHLAHRLVMLCALDCTLAAQRSQANGYRLSTAKEICDDNSGISYLLIGLTEPHVRPSRHGAAHGKSIEHLEYWLRHHIAIETPIGHRHSIKAATAPQGEPYDSAMLRLTAARHVNVACAVPVDAQTITFTPAHPSLNSFTVIGLTDSSARASALRALIDKASDARVDILVLPEFCADQACLSSLIQYLHAAKRQNPAFVVIGSLEPNCVDASKPTDNRAHLLLGETGQEVCAQPKLTGVDFIGEDLACMTEHLPLCDTVWVLPSPIGIVCLAICKDLFDAPTAGTYELINPCWLLVPSMSNSCSPHDAAAKTLWDKKRIHSYIANIRMPEPPTSDPPEWCHGVGTSDATPNVNARSSDFCAWMNFKTKLG